ncbi:hypothetical protein D3C81_2130970 [compost metagenome]
MKTIEAINHHRHRRGDGGTRRNSISCQDCRAIGQCHVIKRRHILGGHISIIKRNLDRPGNKRLDHAVQLIAYSVNFLE